MTSSSCWKGGDGVLSNGTFTQNAGGVLLRQTANDQILWWFDKKKKKKTAIKSLKLLHVHSLLRH